MSLALYLARHLDNEDLDLVLRAFPFGQIGSGKLSGQAADRRIGRLLAKAEQAREASSYGNTQDGIAQCFTDRHKKDLRYCHTTGAWFEWLGTHWQEDKRRSTISWARAVGRMLDSDGKAATCAGAEKFAQSDPILAVTHEIWSADPFLIGTPGGGVDLRSGEMRPARREDYITRLTAVAPQPGEHRLWSRFLTDATSGDGELARYLQRMGGHALAGDTAEHALFFVYGPGGDGKSVFLNVLTGIMGDYSRTAAMDTFETSRSDRHPTDLAMLAGARLVTASESDEGRAWAESRIKQLTGGDTIAARFMRQDFFEYRPQFKLVVIGNHRPALRNVDDAARRRFNIIPFVHKPSEPDKDLERKLGTEWPQILRWMIDGCIDWQAEGLGPPERVRSATADYFDEQDLFGQWLVERCSTHKALSETSAKLFADWRVFAERSGIDAGTTTSFGNRLGKAGFEKGKLGAQKGWKGLACKHADAREDWGNGETGPGGTGWTGLQDDLSRAPACDGDNVPTGPTGPRPMGGRRVGTIF